LLARMASENKGVFLAPTTYVVLLIHLVICIVLIACTTPGDGPINLGGVLVYPQLQWANSAFCCLSIVSIIAAGVGTLYLIESHLTFYFYLLLLSAAVDLFWLVIFICFGQSCTTRYHDQATVNCSFSAGGAVGLVTIIALFKVLGMTVVSRTRSLVRIQYNADLLPHLKQSLSQSLSGMNLPQPGMGRAFGAPGGGNAFPPAQPAEGQGYGSVTQRIAIDRAPPRSSPVLSQVPRISTGTPIHSSPASLPVPSNLRPVSM